MQARTATRDAVLLIGGDESARCRAEIVVRSSRLALGVDALYEGDRVAFDVDMGTNAQARKVMRT